MAIKTDATPPRKPKLRGLNNLTQLKINALLKGGKDPTENPSESDSTKRRTKLHGDGGGLYLQITPEGSASWLFRYMIFGKARAMGLGALHIVTLAEARKAAHACRLQVHNGIDPLEEKRRKKQIQAPEDGAQAITFQQCANKFIDTHNAGWKNKKHAAQWKNTLSTYAFPIIGDLPIVEVDVDAILKILEPIWTTKTETASRVRGRIEKVLDWATARGYRTGENPARWKGHLGHLLARKSGSTKVKHHSALPYSQIRDFVTSLRTQTGIAQSALEFTILTAARTSEVINMQWSEVSIESQTWTVPAERMKSGREHRVPLSSRCIEILQQMKAHQSRKFVFPGRNPEKPLSNMALLQILRRMEIPITVHGFRATFRTWASECTDFPREVEEAALAHIIKDATEAAYARGDLFEKRRELMADWSAFCTTRLT